MTAKPDAARAALAAEALAHLPKLLMLQDRSPTSPTFGCFDRGYWHMRTADFPCGITQTFLLPLALAYALPIPGSPYYQQDELRRWAIAGVRFAARSAHPDGSCDDYYPFERASGAAAFSLFACLEAADIFGLWDDAEIIAFCQKRAGWLARHEESGRLSNHEAIIIACLARLAERLGGEWHGLMQARAARLMGWQSSEGWFDEYGGMDPGYLTLTIAMLTDAEGRFPALGLKEPIRAAIRFLSHCIAPDGSLGGEWTSRATVNFFPHGLEMAGAFEPLALQIADVAYRRFVSATQPCHADDRIGGHHVWSQLLAWREWQAVRPEPLAFEDGLKDFPDAKLRVQQRGRLRLVCGWSRGGAFRLFDDTRLLHADTGPSLRLTDGRVAIANLDGARVAERTDNGLVIETPLAYAKSALLTPFKSIVLRAIMLTAGRFFPDLVRRMLQKLLVTGRKDAPFRFRRTLMWQGDALIVEDEIHAEQGWGMVAEAGQSGFQVGLTTVMARVWEPAQLQPWRDLTGDIAALAPGAPLVVRQVFRSGQ
ncbi:MAG: hypothetical protein MUF47_00150 [Porphyrobacter sp.]|nr:hypothetical protein [Porphyrobacter sp.]